MQPRHRGLGLAISCAALGLTACTTPTALSHSAIGYNTAIADAADSQLLLNIMRAAYRNPTHYTAVSQMRDSRSVSGTASVSGTFPFGPDATFGNLVSPNLSTSGNLSPSFDVAPLDTRAAAEGLFHPIDPKIFVTYWQQGWPKMMLLFLFVDDVRLDQTTKEVCHIEREFVDNAAYSYRAFATARKLFECIRRYIHYRRKPSHTSFLTNASVSPNVVLKSLPDLVKNDFDVTEGKDKKTGKKVFSVSKSTESSSLILQFYNGRRSLISMSTKNGGGLSFNMRSVDGMVYYLGELVRLQNKIGESLLYRERRHFETLFNVRTNAAGEPAQEISARFLGDRYSISRIPSETDRSLSVLSLLTQVFALYREEKELPKTEAVQIVGAR